MPIGAGGLGIGAAAARKSRTAVAVTAEANNILDFGATSLFDRLIPIAHTKKAAITGSGASNALGLVKRGATCELPCNTAVARTESAIRPPDSSGASRSEFWREIQNPDIRPMVAMPSASSETGSSKPEGSCEANVTSARMYESQMVPAQTSADQKVHILPAAPDSC
ncbi:hypothetical protein GCM10009077_14890 [Roseibium denhamense]